MIHSDGFTPFFGVVENVDDPNKSGLYQVRVYGYNSDNRGILPTENLKWMRVGVSNSAAMSGVGDSPTGLLVGSFVKGVYIDSDKQEGIIEFAFHGINGDVSPIATGEGGPYLEALRANVVAGVQDARGETWDEPSTRYATVYPNNKVFQSKSGHVVEYDDTPGAERVTFFHRSGTFEEIHPDGKKVEKTVGESFEIRLGGHNILVNGNLNLSVGGDYRVSVGGEYCVKAGNVVFDTPNVDIYGVSNANDHISSNVSGMSHVHSGVQPGPGMTAVPVGASTSFSPSPANKFALAVEDTGYTPEVIEFALSQGFLTQEDVYHIQNDEAVVDGLDETPKVEVKPVITDCGLAIGDDGKVDYSVMLSPNVSLRSVSIGAVVSQYAIKDQGGLTKQEIICNLKNVAENVIEPLKAKYPNMMVTSAFRHGSGRSQHERGEAIDVQFKGVTKAFYFEAAQWVKTNLPHDQLLLEYQSRPGGNPWIHISLKRDRQQRYQVMTFFNHRKHSDGLVKLA